MTCSFRTADGLSSQATALYNKQCNLNHRVGFAFGELSVLPGGADSTLHPAPEPPFVQGAPMASTSMEEVKVVLVPTCGGSSHGAEPVNNEPITVTLKELPPTASEPLVPFLNS